MGNFSRFLVLPILCFLSYAVVGQKSILDRNIDFRFKENTVIGHIDNLLVQENITLAFNSKRVDLDQIVKLPDSILTLREVILQLFEPQKIELTPSVNKVIITFSEAPAKKTITVKGHITDSKTGEIIIGASIVDLENFTSSFSNEYGFYSITIPTQSNKLTCRYLGYKEKVIVDIESSTINFKLDFDNELSEVLIRSTMKDNYFIGSGGDKLDMSDTKSFMSVSGENDLISNVRTQAGVQSGNEAQGGLFVRGGGSDQNLILLEGVPLYEVNHTAGFASMFIEESIHNADFIKSGFPARFGGRLSSVLNVQLKEGNKSGYHGSVHTALPGAKLHLEGPLFNKNTSINLSGRLSYVDTYLNSLLDGIIDYDNIGLDYHDFVGKITHNLSSTKKVSASYYTGGDNLSLFRSYAQSDSTGGHFNTTNTNQLSWGSTVWSTSFSNVVSDKLMFKLNFGSINYKYSSRGAFTFESIQDALVSYQEVDVISNSQIKDYVFGLNFDYYLSDKHRIKLGLGANFHTFNPAIRHSTEIIDGAVSTVGSDDEKNIVADEIYGYIEDTYTPTENWKIYGGMYYSQFRSALANYSHVQPRLKVIYSPNSYNRFSLSYSKMVQYVHLLVNPGIGLPSDLWVPSTDKIKPQEANQFSLSYTTAFANGLEFSMSGYLKDFSNLVEYSTTVDIFFKVVNSPRPPIFVNDDDWRERVVNGDGYAKGLEFQLKKIKGTITGWLAYNLSNSTRKFDQLNSGKEYLDKFDRLHDINIGINYKINPSMSISTNWVYGTGNNFSLAIEEFTSIFEIFPRTTDERNNYQYPAFHHLDIQWNYKKQFANSNILNLSVGLYNVYSRKNAYYIYIVDNNLTPNSEARKTSLFPILPNIAINYEF